MKSTSNGPPSRCRGFECDPKHPQARDGSPKRSEFEKRPGGRVASGDHAWPSPNRKRDDVALHEILHCPHSGISQLEESDAAIQAARPVEDFVHNMYMHGSRATILNSGAGRSAPSHAYGDQPAVATQVFKYVTPTTKNSFTLPEAMPLATLSSRVGAINAGKAFTIGGVTTTDKRVSSSPCPGLVF